MLMHHLIAWLICMSRISITKNSSHHFWPNCEKHHTFIPHALPKIVMRKPKMVTKGKDFSSRRCRVWKCLMSITFYTLLSLKNQILGPECNLRKDPWTHSRSESNRPWLFLRSHSGPDLEGRVLTRATRMAGLTH
jgi:hypothetical protein